MTEMARNYRKDCRPFYQPLVDMHTGGRPYSEMAATLGITKGSVAGAIYRLRHGRIRNFPQPNLPMRRPGMRVTRTAGKPSLPRLRFLEDQEDAQCQGQGRDWDQAYPNSRPNGVRKIKPDLEPAG